MIYLSFLAHPYSVSTPLFSHLHFIEIHSVSVFKVLHTLWLLFNAITGTDKNVHVSHCA